MEKSKTAFVLSGGGSFGSFEVGVWQAVREAGIEIDMTCGASVGAINAAMVVLGDADRAAELWQTLETDMIFDIDVNEQPYNNALESLVKNIDEIGDRHEKYNDKIDAVGSAIGKRGIELGYHISDKIGMSVNEALLYMKGIINEHGVGSSGLLEILKKYISADDFFGSSVDYGMVTCGYPGFEPYYFYKDEIPRDQLHEYIVASASCFPAARYAVIGDKKFVDGGYADNMPVKMAQDRGADRIIAVNLDAVGKLNKDVIEKAKEKGTDFVLAESSWDLGNWLAFEPETAARNLRLGYLDGMKALALLDGDKYTFKKGEFKGALLAYANRAAEIFDLDPEVIYDEEIMCDIIKPRVRDSQLMLRAKAIMPRVPARKIDPKEEIAKVKKVISDYAAEAVAVYIAESLADYGTKSVFMNDHLIRLMKREIGAAKFIVAKGLLSE